MNPEIPKAPLSAHPAWRIWSNPIFRRYCRSRLRPRGLGVWLLLTVVIAGFLFALFRSIALYRGGLVGADAERGPLIPLLIFQGVILFVIGTAQVAGGMTSERDEGVIDYQRLIPMSPLSKVLGYLFGLPVREYLLFFATLPFTAWAIWKGNVAVETWLPLYAVFLSSTLLYHLTGLVTGTVVKNRRWAFLTSIGLVFCLYTVMPQMAKFGLVFFEYLTINPVFEERLIGMVPQAAGEMLATLQRFIPTVKFFNLDFSETVFTFFSQGGLILTFLVMLCRRWKRAESHLLSKIWAVALFAWIQILLLGNALPLIDGGRIFPSREFERLGRFSSRWDPTEEEAMLMGGIYGLVTLVIFFILATTITPTAEHQVQGWRRARKQNRKSLPPFSDPASGFAFGVLMAVMGAVGWYIFTKGLVESRWFPGHVVDLKTFGYFLAVMLSAGVGFQVLLEWKGARTIGLMAILIGVAPLMIGTVMSMRDSLIPFATWVIGLSPISLPIYASGSQLSISDLPFQIALALPRAFIFWLLVTALTTLWMILRLFLTRRAMAKSVLSSPEGRP